MKTVYAVTSGQYSDWDVHCVCTTEAKAIELAAILTQDGDEWEDGEVIEMALWNKDDKPEKLTTYRASAQLWDDLTVTKQHHWDFSGWNFKQFACNPPKRSEVKYWRAPIHQNKGGTLQVTGPSKEAVAKTLSDRITKFASGQWRPQDNAN